MDLHNDPAQLHQHVPAGPTTEIIIRLDPKGTNIRGIVNGKTVVQMNYAPRQEAQQTDRVEDAIDVIKEALDLD